MKKRRYLIFMLRLGQEQQTGQQRADYIMFGVAGEHLELRRDFERRKNALWGVGVGGGQGAQLRSAP